MRGGWNPWKLNWGSLPGDNMWTHDGGLRLLMGGGCGLLAGLLVRRLRRGFAIAVFVAVVTYFSLFGKLSDCL